MKKAIDLLVNGDVYELCVAPHRLLVDVLRDDIGLTGTKKGCGVGECGSCTVLMDGKPVRSCLILALQAQGKEIVTIEGLGKKGELDPLQRLFLEKNAVQCGFCTSGMILTAKALLKENPNPTEEEVRDALAGNLCRCTGYVKIVDAIMAAAESNERR